MRPYAAATLPCCCGRSSWKGFSGSESFTSRGRYPALRSSSEGVSWKRSGWGASEGFVTARSAAAVSATATFRAASFASSFAPPGSAAPGSVAPRFAAFRRCSCTFPLAFDSASAATFATPAAFGPASRFIAPRVVAAPALVSKLVPALVFPSSPIRRAAATSRRFALVASSPAAVARALPGVVSVSISVSISVSVSVAVFVSASASYGSARDAVSACARASRISRLCCLLRLRAATRSDRSAASSGVSWSILSFTLSPSRAVSACLSRSRSPWTRPSPARCLSSVLASCESGKAMALAAPGCAHHGSSSRALPHSLGAPRGFRVTGISSGRQRVSSMPSMAAVGARKCARGCWGLFGCCASDAPMRSVRRAGRADASASASRGALRAPRRAPEKLEGAKNPPASGLDARVAAAPTSAMRPVAAIAARTRPRVRAREASRWPSSSAST